MNRGNKKNIFMIDNQAIFPCFMPHILSGKVGITSKKKRFSYTVINFFRFIPEEEIN